MAVQKYFVTLEQSERIQLEKVVRSGNHNARMITRARILLMANETDATGVDDHEICTALGVSQTTPQNVRKRYSQGGIKRALYDAPRPGKPRTFTPADQATVVAIACTTPPDGYGTWTLDLIVRETIKKIGKQIGRNTVDKILLQNDCKPWLKKNVVHQ